MFGCGRVLTHIDASGRVHREHPMEHDVFVAHLRQALASTGLPEAEAKKYTAHLMRSGAATEAVPCTPGCRLFLSAKSPSSSPLIGSPAICGRT